MSDYEMRAALERAGHGEPGVVGEDVWLDANRKFEVIVEKIAVLSETVPIMKEQLMSSKFLTPELLRAARDSKGDIERAARAISTMAVQIFIQREVYIDPSVVLGQTWKNNLGHKAVTLRENRRKPGSWDMSNGETWDIYSNRENYQFIDSVLPQEGDRR